jgi:hypothetical protein
VFCANGHRVWWAADGGLAGWGAVAEDLLSDAIDFYSFINQ